MTGNTGDDTTARGASTDAGSSAPRSSRRTVLKAAGAAAVGSALGTSVPGTAGAQQAGSAPPMLERESRSSNLIVDPQGNRVTVRGVNIVDPLRSARDAPHYKYRGERATQLATNEEDGWYANCIRVPMQPNDIARSGAGAVEPGAYSQEQLESYLELYVDPIVEECAYQGVYCILDYHRHWPDGPRWDDPALSEELHQFWDTVAPRYADRSHVIYELFNEPTEPYAGYEEYQGGPDVTDPESEQTWLDWREQAQPWVDTIRQHAANLTIVGNPRWSQWVYWAPEHEFEGENLGYVGHFYTQENLRPLSTYFGEPSEEVPVFITEFGVGGSEEHMNGPPDVHLPEFTEFFEEFDAAHPIGWCFDFDWEPSMLDRDYEVATEWGEWMQSHLADKAGLYEPYDPSGGVTPPSTPSGLEATAIGDTVVEVDWTPVDGADGYNVYSTQELLGQVSGPPVAVGGLEASSIEWVGVTAYNAGGSSSYVEVEVNTAPEGEGADLEPDIGGDAGDGDGNEGPSEPPAAPTDLTVTGVTDSSVSLSWSGVETADSYNVYVDGSLEASVRTTSTTISPLAPDTQYEFAVESLNTVGSSDDRATTTATTESSDGEVCGGAESASSTTVDGQTVCDLNDDGLYRDVNGDGTLGQDDVVHFFENQHREAWQRELFDFSENGSVGHGDVVALFEDAAV